jgi:predicted RNA-binding Zn-ribbon protein involved in translation (DUF1610 family)
MRLHRVPLLPAACDSILDDHDHTHATHRCPQCGSTVKRVMRSENDKRRWDAEQWHRYHCRNEQCDWQGLLRVAQRPPQSPRRPLNHSLLARLGRGMLYWLLAGGLAWTGLQALKALIDG